MVKIHCRSKEAEIILHKIKSVIQRRFQSFSRHGEKEQRWENYNKEDKAWNKNRESIWFERKWKSQANQNNNSENVNKNSFPNWKTTCLCAQRAYHIPGKSKKRNEHLDISWCN